MTDYVIEKQNEEREAEMFREENQKVEDYHSSRCESQMFSNQTD